MSLLQHLSAHPPRYGPEWGSGGIFGLKYHRGVLYYTLAMEARAYFFDHGGLRRVYEFERVGPKPVSGGDTYNAVEAVDGRIYFGGWVHAPAVYRGRHAEGATIDFRNKYSHVHVYDIEDDRVELLWKEGLQDPERWACEVSEIIYNPYRDELLVARADGHENHGVFSLDPRTRAARRVLEGFALKGAHHLEYSCFVLNQHPHDVEGIACVDMVEDKHFVEKIKPVPVDGWPASRVWAGPVASAYGWLFAFTRGGLILGDIFSGEYYFVRLFDIPGSQLGPTRTNAVALGGGVLVAYNSYTYGVIKTVTEEERRWKRLLGPVTSPSLLLYVAPPSIRVIAALGARITSIESLGGEILLGTNTMSNTQRHDASPFDQGTRGFVILNHSVLTNSTPAFTIVAPGWTIGASAFGGVPLAQFKEPRLVVYSKRGNTLHVKEYFPTLPPTPGDSDKIKVKPGKNVVDLASYSGVVSFKAEQPLSSELVVLELR
jgi:hypothetical protein